MANFSHPKQAESHEDDDCHVVEAASHRAVQAHALKREIVSDGHHWDILSRVQRDIKVINQLGHHLRDGGGPMKRRTVSAKRDWKK